MCACNRSPIDKYREFAMAMIWAKVARPGLYYFLWPKRNALRCSKSTERRVAFAAGTCARGPQYRGAGSYLSACTQREQEVLGGYQHCGSKCDYS